MSDAEVGQRCWLRLKQVVAANQSLLPAIVMQAYKL